MKPWNYLILLLLPVMVVTGYYLGGWWNFLVPGCCFAAYPVSNFFISSQNHTPVQNTESFVIYRRVTLIFIPVLLLLTGWSVYIAGNIAFGTTVFSGLALSVGMVNGVLGFTLAHEFIHHFKKGDQLAGYLLLLQNNYMHYGIEHVWGHHVYACTPDDPHTARVNESLYAFLPRTVINTYKNAWKLETKKLSRSSKASVSVYNRVLIFGVLQSLVMLTIFLVMGSKALCFFLLQNIIAILLLHVINYIQHYGLARSITSTGKYERIDGRHAWNAGYTSKTVDLFHLENHANHHIHPHLSFEQLTRDESSPEHPTGYSFMVLLALVPPLWFKIMNKRIPSHHSNKQS